jgi:hypothetical protein
MRALTAEQWQVQVEERDSPGGTEAGAHALVRVLLQSARRQVR